MVTKIAVIGANGQVATELIKKLAGLKEEFEPTAFIRSSSQSGKFEELGVKYSTDIDLIESDLSSITKSLKGFDVVIFSAGSGGSGLDNMFAVDLDGAVKVSEATKAAGIKRFLLVSTIKSLEREAWWNSPIRFYFIAKKYADEVISKDQDLDWTIFQPGWYVDEDGTGLVEDPTIVDETTDDIGGPGGRVSISRQDVAQAIVESLRNDNTIKKFIPLIKGKLEIKDALKNL